jgi:lysozyme
MKTSERGINLIKKHESLRLKSYLCPAKVWTIGYGHTKTAKSNMKITESQAVDLLISDLNTVEMGVNTLTKGMNLNQNQYDALVSFVFNVGIGAFRSSTLLKRIKVKESKDKIKEAFMMWRFGGNGENNGIDDNGNGLIDEPGEKQLLKGLVNRRNDEAELFFTV